MTTKYMAPFRWGIRKAPARQGFEGLPVNFFSGEMNQLVDEFFKGFGSQSFSQEMESFGAFNPSVDMTEDESAIQVTAELPGMDEKDIEINLTRDSLTITGEKKIESEKGDKESSYLERSFGSFKRVLPIPVDVDPDKAEAVFVKGVLNIKLPKLVKGKTAQKKIKIKSA